MRVARGDLADPFVTWWMASADTMMKAFAIPATTDPLQARRLFINLGRKFWSSIPLPARGWRTHPKLEAQRNDPCFCDSGQKYKHCCQAHESLPALLPPESALAMVVDSMGAASQEKILKGDIPPHAMAHLAELWNDRDEYHRTADVFVPYFESDPVIDERCEPLFDALMTAMLELGMGAKRETLLKKMSTHRDDALAVGALSRLASMYSDLGNFEDAWQAFRTAQRRSPDDPQLAHLEILLLNAEGREDEARVRAPMIAARLRKLSPDYERLASVVEQLAEGGVESLRRDIESDYAPEEIGAWIMLGDAARRLKIDAAECKKIYKISSLHNKNAGEALRSIATAGALKKVETKWERQFPVDAPMSTQGIGDIDSVIEELPDAENFMRANPLAWSSIEVLDVLLQVGIALYDETQAHGVLAAANHVGAYAAKLAKTVLAENLDQPTPWMVMENRPLLRMLSNAAHLADLSRDKKAFIALIEWLLKLNPNDNHGWRGHLVQHRLVKETDAAGALEILERYPNDFPSAQFQHVLALFMLDRKDDAAAQWIAAAQASANIVKALFAASISEPREDMQYGIKVGGEWEAHQYRVEMRSLWKRSGALAWAQALPPVKAKTKAKAAPGKTVGAKKSAAAQRAKKTAALPNTDDSATSRAASNLSLNEILDDARAHLPNAARIIGMLTGVVWSPNAIRSAQWLNSVMPLLSAHGEPPEFATLQTTLDRLMTLYNALNDEVLNGANEAALPRSVLRFLATEEEADFALWSAGFIEGCQQSAVSWRSAGVNVSARTLPFAPLFTIAARASLAPTGSTSVVRNDQGQLLLSGLDAPAPHTVDTLKISLMPLWDIARRRGDHADV